LISKPWRFLKSIERLNMKTLALDLGLKRIGVALCVNKTIAIPLNAVFRKNRNQAVAEISALLKEHDIKTLLIGVSEGASSEDEMKRRAKHFASLLDFGGELVFVDEAFSSKDASALRNESTQKSKFSQKDGKLDSLAALILLKNYYHLL